MLIFYIMFGAGGNLLFVAAASIFSGQAMANRFSVLALTATGQLLRTMDHIPHPEIFY